MEMCTSSSQARLGPSGGQQKGVPGPLSETIGFFTIGLLRSALFRARPARPASQPASQPVRSGQLCQSCEFTGASHDPRGSPANSLELLTIHERATDQPSKSMVAESASATDWSYRAQLPKSSSGADEVSRRSSVASQRCRAPIFPARDGPILFCFVGGILVYILK